jgi:hypothetical protein
MNAIVSLTPEPAEVVQPGNSEPLDDGLSSEAKESVGFLEELALEALNKHAVLFRQASDGVVSTIENSIRLGWYLSDLRSFMRPGPGFITWAAKRFELSTTHCAHLMALSKHFCRDLVDQKTREKLSIRVPGLNPTVGVHLRNQIVEAAPKSLNELFRATGILPTLPGRNGNGAGPTTHLRQLESLLQQFSKKIPGVDPDSIPASKREQLLTELKPVIGFYTRLRALDP